MLNSHYILDDNNVPTPVDLLTWAYWMEEHMQRKIVAQDSCAAGTCWVSTVFLGLDHRFYGEGPPIIFESMVFNGALDGFQDRYCTWAQADAYHRLVIMQVEEIPLWKHAVANVWRDLKDWWKDLVYEVKGLYSKDPLVQAMLALKPRRYWWNP